MKALAHVVAVAAVAAGCALAAAQGAYASIWITSGPAGTLDSNKATFRFKGPRKTVFTCRLDAGAIAACSSPEKYTGLGEGSHTFQLRNSGSSDVDSWTWIVDTTPPAAPAIVSGPDGAVSATTASFAFTGEPGASFTCTAAGAFKPCTSPQTYTQLADGTHTFGVRQRDPAGNVSPAATRTWTVDTHPPAAPTLQASTNGTDATFGFAGETAATFRCVLDDASPAPCTSPRAYTALSGGGHAFGVRQYDLAGNESPPATDTWTVELSPPAIERIDASCAGDVLRAEAVASGAVGSRFELVLHAAAGGGAYSPTPQSASFTVETSAATRYAHDFDVATVGGDSFKVVSSTGVESNVVDRSSCGPGTVVAEAPSAALLPLSILAMLALVAAIAYARRRVGAERAR